MMSTDLKGAATPPVTLKACPFCGGDPIQQETSWEGQSRILCEDCLIHTEDDSDADVIAAWNQRIDPDVTGVRVPDGSKLVPVVPTEAMLLAAERTGFSVTATAASAFWSAMLAATPAAPRAITASEPSALADRLLAEIDEMHLSHHPSDPSHERHRLLKEAHAALTGHPPIGAIVRFRSGGENLRVAGYTRHLADCGWDMRLEKLVGEEWKPAGCAFASELRSPVRRSRITSDAVKGEGEDGITLAGIGAGEGERPGWAAGVIHEPGTDPDETVTSPPAALDEHRAPLAFGRAYFERGFMAGYAWCVTSRDPALRLADSDVDHAWGHRDEGMDGDDLLPVALATSPRAAELREALEAVQEHFDGTRSDKYWWETERLVRAALRSDGEAGRG